jgi:signal transduction histidine kinase
VGKENFWEQLCSIQTNEDISAQVLDDKLLLRIRNGGSWLFSKDEISVNRKTYVQILAHNITEQDLLTQEIEETNNRLEVSGAELEEAIANMEQTEKEKEILRIKTNIHDMLGARLSILHHYLEDDNVAYQMDKIRPLLEGFPQIIVDKSSTSLNNDMALLIDSYAMVGTTLLVEGNIPDGEVSDVLTKVLRECTTNAFRHGNAKNVHAVFGETDVSYTLSVSNDGIPPTRDITEGTGIQGMRGRICEYHGTLEIKPFPDFCVIATIPKK